MIDTMPPRLLPDSVHVWSVPLATGVHELGQLLSADERERAGRFHQPRDRARFVERRRVLRILVGYYLDIDPQAVRFEYGAHGKPRVAAHKEPQRLEFNLSHSDDVALIAFAWDRAVGVDVERVRPLPEMDDLARTFFSAHEKKAWLALPEGERLVAFYHCWTRKEAYLKATGKGLASRMGEFDVSLAPGEPARLLRVEGDEAEAARWSLRTVVPADEYTGAVAVKGHGWHLSELRWDEGSQNQGA